MFSSLFYLSLHDHFKNLQTQVVGEVNNIPFEELGGVDAEQLATNLMEKYRAACPEFVGGIKYDNPPYSEGAGSTVVMVYVPFKGDQNMFQLNGGYAPVISQKIEVYTDHLAIPMRVEVRDMEDFPNKVNRLVEQIKSAFPHIEQQLTQLNPRLKQHALARIQERQMEFRRHQGMLTQLAKSGFTLRRRDDGMEKLIVPVTPKQLAIQAVPKAAAPKSAGEPELSIQDYDEILGVIRSMVTVFERSPSVFKGMNEEDLRTILLVALNGLFKGEATGETFNGSGKTDILIRVKDKNVLIVECLIWRGEKVFRKKLTDQLFQYATWRDSKLAAIVFNRQKDFSGVVAKMKEVVTGLPNRVSDLPYPMDTACRHQMRREDDAQKHFVLTCLAFEVPT